MASNNKQLLKNMTTSVISLALSWGIAFFLTPYIVKYLGTSSMGFVGLSESIIGYITIATVALNSMSGRYISLHYHRKEYELSNSYISATFFSNLIFAVTMMIGFFILTIFLENVINIPENLVTDVKILFVLLVISNAVCLIGGVFGSATFVSNRLDKSNTVGMVGNLLRSGILIMLFYFFEPKLWYFGLSGLFSNIYTLGWNYYWFKTLTPDLAIIKSIFDFKKVLELIKSGIWNLISSLSILINEGLDLLFANLFISANAMGILTLSKVFDGRIKTLAITLVNSFSPQNMQLYAENKIDKLCYNLLFSSRLMGVVASVPICIIFVYSDIFFKLWIPNENSQLIAGLCIVATALLMVALPYQGLWYLCIIDNKLKESSISAISNSIMTFIITIVGVYFFENEIIRLFILVGTRTVMSSIRCLTFLPNFMSKIFKITKSEIYMPIIKTSITIIIGAIPSLFLKYLISDYNWFNLILMASISGCINIIIGFYIILNTIERNFVINQIKSRFSILSTKIKLDIN